MKRILDKWDKFRLGHKLHQLQKRYKRARLNGYEDKAQMYKRRIDDITDKLRNIKQ
jgi:hypothetical protein